MDPLLEAATTKLNAKLEEFRAEGINVPIEDMEAFMRRETGNKFGLADAQALVQQFGEASFGNAGRALLSGATFGFGDEIMDAFDEGTGATARLKDRAFRTKHPVLSGGLKAVGSLTAPLVAAAAAPEIVGAGAAGALGATALRALGLGAAAGAAIGAGEAEPGSRLQGAVTGGLAGAVAGPAARLVSPLAASGASRLSARTARVVAGLRGAPLPPTFAEKRAIKQAGRLLPEGLEQQAARQEMLAPESFIPAGSSQEAAQSIGAGVGANPTAALAAERRVRQAIQKVSDAKAEIGAGYDQLGASLGPIPVDNELRDILHLVGEDQLGANTTIGFFPLQAVRTKYAEKLARATTAAQKRTFSQFKKRLTDWLRPRAPGLSELDSRFFFLSRTEENLEKLLETVERSNIAHGKNALFGVETGSIGGTLPSGVRGMTINVLNALRPGKAGRAAAVANTLIAPADATMAARLGASQRAAMLPPGPRPIQDFSVPFASGSAIAELLAQLQGKPLGLGPQ